MKVSYTENLTPPRETHYWLRLLVVTELVPEAKLAPLLDESDQLVAILTSIVKNARKNRSNDA